MIRSTMFRRLLPLAVLVTSCAWAQTTINYPARAPSNWPLFIAKEGGYFEKYGLDAKLVFGVHPAGIAMLVCGEAAMTNYTLEQALQAASKDARWWPWAAVIARACGRSMASKNIASVRDLKGKRIGISQIGDAPYNYTVAVLAKFGDHPARRAVGDARHRRQWPRRRAHRRSRGRDAAHLARLFQAGGRWDSRPSPI